MQFHVIQETCYFWSCFVSNLIHWKETDHNEIFSSKPRDTSHIELICRHFRQFKSRIQNPKECIINIILSLFQRQTLCSSWIFSLNFDFFFFTIALKYFITEFLVPINSITAITCLTLVQTLEHTFPKNLRRKTEALFEEYGLYKVYILLNRETAKMVLRISS